MAKFYHYLAVVAIAMSSCSEETILKEDYGSFDGETLYANLGGDTDSRISISGMNLHWEKNDVFTVYDNDGIHSTKFILERGEGTSAGVFKPLDGGNSEKPVLAVYPSLEGSLKGNVLSVTLPSSYEAEKAQNSPMIGELKGNKVTFQHAMAIIKFDLTNIPEGYNAVKVNADEPIAGEFKINDITSGNVALVKNNETGKSVTINGIANDKLFYLPIPANTFKKLEFHVSNGTQDRPLATIENKTLACGSMYTLSKDKLDDQDIYSVIMDRVRANNMKEVGESTITKYLNLQGEDGAFSDIDYNHTANSNWKPAFHYDRVYEMACAYSTKGHTYYGNEELYNGIVNGLNYWYTRNPKTGSWWYYEISIPQKITLTLIHMRYSAKQVPAELEDKLLQRITSKTHGMNPGKVDGPRTGANLTDICLHYIYRSCLEKNETDLTKALEYAFKPLRYVSNGEGIQIDNSYFQHENQLYIGSYGDELLKGITLIGEYAAGTEFALNGEKLEILSKFFRETYMGVMRGSYMSFDVLGRAVSRENGIRKYGGSSFAKRMMKLDPAHKVEYEAIVKRQDSGDPTYDIKPRHTHYYVGDYTMHIRPKYLFDVRMVSSRTIRCEALNGENVLGYHISDGGTNITVSGGEYFNIFPLWNWTRVPGTTAPQAPQPPYLNPTRKRGIPTFAGGVSDDLYGATGYSYFDEGYYGANNSGAKINTGANKSWFFFDDEVVCLGNVKSSSSHKVRTTINQCWGGYKTVSVKQGETVSVLGASETSYENPTWIHHYNIGYVFPQGGNIWAERVTKRGNWNTINTGINKGASGQVFTLGIDHNSVANFTPYAYIVVPGINSTAEMNTYMENNAIKVVSNTPQIQSVYHNNLKIWQTIFFEEGSLKFEDIDLELTVNRGCAVMVRQTATPGRYDVYAADPARTNQVITLEFKNSKGSSKKYSSRVYGQHNGKTQKLSPALMLK